MVGKSTAARTMFTTKSQRHKVGRQRNQPGKSLCVLVSSWLLPAVITADTLLVQLAHATFITWWWYAEQGVATRSEPVVEDGTKFRERPNAHDGSEPLPMRQHANDFNPGEVTFVPMPIRWSNVHLLGHFFARVRRCAVQNFRIVVIQPFQPSIAIEWLNMFARPAAQVAIAVCVNLDFRLSCQS